MIVSNATPPTSAQASSPASGTLESLDTTTFLKLLMAEMKHQDPTKPMDTMQMVQQLSSFAQVEQATATNAKLSSILDAISVGQAASLIGRTVVSADNTQSGAVGSVVLSENGLIAKLTSGQEIAIGPGVTVR